MLYSYSITNTTLHKFKDETGNVFGMLINQSTMQTIPAGFTKENNAPNLKQFYSTFARSLSTQKVTSRDQYQKNILRLFLNIG